MRMIKILAAKIFQNTNIYRKAKSKRKADLKRSARKNPGAKRKLFLTGDLGKLGSKVADYLQEDYDLVGFDLKAEPKEHLDNYELIKERMSGCQYVVHAAAIPHPDKGPFELYFNVNVLGSYNVMRAAAENKVKRLVFISSVNYYGMGSDNCILKPAYFPIDEAHPIASVPGYSAGDLASYDQSKVLAEQTLAYYGRGKYFEAISLRLAPANSKKMQYPADGKWKLNPGFRKRTFYSNVDPETVCAVIKSSLEQTGEFWYEAFNICDRYVYEEINVPDLIKEEYPDVLLKEDFSDNHSLISIAKAEQYLDFKPYEGYR